MAARLRDIRLSEATGFAGRRSICSSTYLMPTGEMMTVSLSRSCSMKFVVSNCPRTFFLYTAKLLYLVHENRSSANTALSMDEYRSSSVFCLKSRSSRRTRFLPPTSQISGISRDDSEATRASASSRDMLWKILISSQTIQSLTLVIVAPSIAFASTSPQA